MKIKITLKDPDGVFESVREAVNESVSGVTGLSEDEGEQLRVSRREILDEAIRPWVKYGEYVTIEIDTETNTATVCKA